MRCIKLDVRIEVQHDHEPNISIDSIYSTLPAAFLEDLAALIRKHSQEHAEYLLDLNLSDGIKVVRLFE